jgi:hypothetical protein
MPARVCSVKTYPEAIILSDLLEASGFHPLEVRTAPHVSVAGTEQFYYLEVPEEEAEDARNCLKENQC